MGILLAEIFTAVVLTAGITAFVVRRYDEKKIWEYQDMILRTQREEIQSIYKTMRGWRHDYHNHMQKIKAHLALNQIEELKDYLNRLEEDLDAIDIAIKTGNVSVDAILSSKLSAASGRGIAINCKARVPETLAVSDVDLCVILGNLIDNGVEACGRVKEKDKRFLRIYIGIFKEQLYISVSNSTNEVRRRLNRELISKKLGNHGHGLRRIDRIVGKYSGFVNRKNEPGVFATEVMLPL